MLALGRYALSRECREGKDRHEQTTSSARRGVLPIKNDVGCSKKTFPMSRFLDPYQGFVTLSAFSRGEWQATGVMR